MENYFDIKFRLWYEHKLDPDWVESIPFYEYQIWVDKLNSVIKIENEEAKNKDGLKEVFSFTR